MSKVAVGPVAFDWDQHEWDELLAAWEEPEVKKTLRKARGAYGRAGAPILRAATPVGKRPGGAGRTSGNLQRLTRYKAMKAKYGVGAVIAAMPARSKTGPSAYYRHMVTGGTARHLILPRDKGGRLAAAFGFRSSVYVEARANPYVARAAGDVESAGFAAAEPIIFAGLDARRISEPEE